MTGHEIRQRFLDFFHARGHRILRSSSLVPANDPTLLFTNPGIDHGQPFPSSPPVPVNSPVEVTVNGNPPRFWVRSDPPPLWTVIR